MRLYTAALNVLLVLSPLLVPRITTGHVNDCDPILQILYVLLALPAVAVILNFRLASRDPYMRPNANVAIGVAAIGPLVFYMKWALSSGYTPFQTDAGSLLTWLGLTFAATTFAWLLAATPLFIRKLGKLSHTD